MTRITSDEECEVSIERLRQALVDGELSDDAGSLDMAQIKRKARAAAQLQTLRHALAEGEDSGEPEPFDMEQWLAEQRDADPKTA